MFLVHPHTRMSSSPSHDLAFGLGAPSSQEKRGFHQRSWAIDDGEIRSPKRRKDGEKFAVGEEQGGDEAPPAKLRGKRNLSAVVYEDEEFFLAERLTLHDRNENCEDEDGGAIECLRKRNRHELAETALDEVASPGEADADYLPINTMLRDLHSAQQRRRNQALACSQGMAMAPTSGSQESEMEVGHELSGTPLAVLLRDLPSTHRHEYMYRCRLERERVQQDSRSEGEGDPLMDMGSCVNQLLTNGVVQGGASLSAWGGAGGPANKTGRFGPFIMSFRSESQKEDEMS